MDLVQWLRDQLDADERIARAATDGPWTPWRGAALHGLGDLLHPVLTPGQKPGAKAVIATASWLDAEHIAAHDPARVLREIDAKRAIVDDLAEFIRWGAYKGLDYQDGVDACGLTLKRLALPYADRPGYREEWRP